MGIKQGYCKSVFCAVRGWNLFWFKCSTDYINWRGTRLPAGWLICTLAYLFSFALTNSTWPAHFAFVAFVNVCSKFSPLFSVSLSFVCLIQLPGSFSLGYLFCLCLYLPTFLNCPKRTCGGCAVLSTVYTAVVLHCSASLTTTVAFWLEEISL